MANERHPTLQALGIRDVRLYVASRFFSGTGQSLLRATLAWHLFQVTQSTLALGLLGLVEFVPVIPVSLIAGALADGVDRRRVVLAAKAAVGVGALGLAWAADAGRSEVVLLYGAAFGIAIASGFERPAASAMFPGLVPRAIFQNAAVVGASVRQLSRIAGPILMGFGAERAGVALPYAGSVALFAAALATMWAVRPQAVERGEGAVVSIAAIGEGLRFVRHNPAILSSMSLDMFAVIFAGATALLPVYAEEILQVGPRGYGLLASAMAIGTTLMTGILMVARPFRHPGRALMGAVFFFGVATVVFGLSRSFPLSIAAFVVAGMADQVSITARSVILQMSTPDALRGRVSSVNMIFIGASNELGEAESGLLASLTSATFSVVAGGFACLGVLVAIALGVPALRRYRPDVDATRGQGSADSS